MKTTEDDQTSRCPFGGEQAATSTGSLSDEILRDIEAIAAALDEVHAISLELWQQGFLRSQDPAQEVARWLHIARTYQHLVTVSFLDVKEGHRAAIFRLLSQCTTIGEDAARREAVAAGMPLPVAQRVLAVYRAA